MTSKRTRFAVSRTISLALAVAIMTGLIALIHGLVAGRIAEQKARAELAPLQQMLPRNLYDNDLLAAGRVLSAPSELGLEDGAKAYIASKAGRPTAIVLPARSPSGYGGPIRLLVAISPGGEILRVKVTGESETPGLGGQIRKDPDGWLKQFEGRSLGNPAPAGWAVTADQGTFDAMSGATVTSRAVIGAIRTALTYFQEHRGDLLPATPAGGSP